MGFVLIEHDLDIALRVVERVTVMHNGRVLKDRHAGPRSRTTPRFRPSTWGATLMAPRRAGARRRARRRRPCWSSNSTSTTAGARAAGRVLHPRRRRPRRRRPQRHRQDDAVQRDHRAGPRARQLTLERRAILGLAPTEITRRGIAYVPQGRRVWPSLRVDDHAAAWPRRSGADVDRSTDVPAPRRAQGQRRRAAFGRRAADAGDRARPAARTRACW